MAIKLDIREQPRLPILKQVEITADGIHHRLFRSMVTLSVVVLAIAFLMNVLTESISAESLKRGVFARSAEVRQFSQFNGFFAGPVDASGMQRRLLAASEGDWRRPILAAWLGMDEQAFVELHAQVAAADIHMTWFEDLNVAHRRLLVENRPAAEAFVWIAQPEGRAQFDTALSQIPTLASPEGFVEFAGRYESYMQRIDAVTGQFNQRRAALYAALGGATLTDRFVAAAADPAARQSLAAMLTSQQIELEPTFFDSLTEHAARNHMQQQLGLVLENAVVGVAWQDAFKTLLVRNDALPVLATDSARSDWLANYLAEHPIASMSDLAWSGADIQAAAEQLIRIRELSELEDRLVANYGREDGIGANVFWLIVVSFLVCIVGITNAMLVSVLERFREIATMKCLGALDGFIAVLFLLEAAFLGLVGGAVGVVLGFLIGYGRMLLSFGGWVLQYFDWSNLFVGAGVSVAAGLALATLAAIYPAWMASRMPPMEAMRLE